MDVNCSFNGSKSCFEFNKYGFTLVLWLRAGLSILATIMNIVAILFIVILKAYKRFVHRLVLYLCCAAIFHATMLAIDFLPVKQKCGYVFLKSPNSCTAIAVLTEYSIWIKLVLMIWFGLHLFFLAVFNKNYEDSRKYELCILLTAITIPFVVSIIPICHIHKVKTYSLAGAWCWIRSTDEDCNEIKAGVIEQFTLWYAPVMLFALAFFLIIVVVIIAIAVKKRRAADEQHVQDQFTRSLKEIRPLLFYPIIFSIIYGLSLFIRVYYTVTKKSILGLWIIQSLSVTFFPLSIPLAFFMHPKIRKLLNYKDFRRAVNNWRYSNAETYFSVSTEGEEECERLIVRGRQAESAGLSSFLNIQK